MLGMPAMGLETAMPSLVFVLFLAFMYGAPKEPPLVYGEGEPAPPLHVASWVRGEPVRRFERGRVYVVEFWASWCGASRRAIERLTALQNAHQEDLIVLAISSRDLQGESLERVTSLVSERGEEIGYRVGFDERRRTARAWLDAFDVRSVPTAFVVNREGLIAWIGNPLWPPGEMEDAAARVLAGPFSSADRGALRRTHLERRERIERAERELEELDRANQPARALRLLDMLIELNPGSAASYAYRRFEVLIAAPGLLEEAYRYGRVAAEGALKHDAERLKSMASVILEEPGVARRDLDLALSAALRAAELTRRQNADVLDTLALAHFRRGEVSKAVEVQRLAFGLAAEDFLRAEYEGRMREYEAAAAEPR